MYFVTKVQTAEGGQLYLLSNDNKKTFVFLLMVN